jgi:hypothetical protein
VGGKGNLGKWRRLYEAYGIPCYTVFDNDAGDDPAADKRRDALHATGVPDADIDRFIGEADWYVGNELTVLGQAYEDAMRAYFATYANLEAAARSQGVDSKPFVARWVAERLDVGSGDPGWQKVGLMVEALRAKLQAGLAGSRAGVGRLPCFVSPDYERLNVATPIPEWDHYRTASICCCPREDGQSGRTKDEQAFLDSAVVQGAESAGTGSRQHPESGRIQHTGNM